MIENINLELRYEHSSFFDVDELIKLESNKFGLYFLYNNNKKVIYIGKASKDIKQRLKYHLEIENPERYDDFNNKWKLHIRKQYRFFTFIEIEKEFIDITEVLMIKKYKPAFNIQFNEKGKLKKEEFRTMYNKNITYTRC